MRPKFEIFLKMCSSRASAPALTLALKLGNGSGKPILKCEFKISILSVNDADGRSE